MASSLRRITTSKNVDDVKTDFYEFYWAHLVEGTELGHVLAWARILVWRWPWAVPGKLFPVWLLLVATVVVVGLFLINAGLAEGERWVELPAWMSVAGGAVVTWFNAIVVVEYIGDAARYLRPTPQNVKQRHEIRRAGIELLRRLHEKGTYRRIVVVGHSLGSVIGYDILTHAWPDYRQGFDATERKRDAALRTLEALARCGALSAIIQPVQRRYLGELQQQGIKWLVTDFITLGSPLTHAEILLADRDRTLEEKIAEREFPVCLPVRESVEGKDRFTYSASFGEPGHERRFWVPHHAAVFAATRWTNLYFPAKFVVFGDLVGGPVGGPKRFGAGVEDVAVSTRAWLGLLTHTRYWSLRRRADEAPSHIERLREAVRIDGAPEGFERWGTVAQLRPAAARAR